VLNSDDHVDKAPATVYAKLLDDGRYLASVSTMYRVLREHGEVGERRRHATHSATVKPELVATAPRPTSPKPSSKTRSASSASNATS
jgi:putative transposase